MAAMLVVCVPVCVCVCVSVFMCVCACSAQQKSRSSSDGRVGLWQKLPPKNGGKAADSLSLFLSHIDFCHGRINHQAAALPLPLLHPAALPLLPLLLGWVSR